MALTKAVIEVEFVEGSKEVIPVMFNPSEYKISKQVNYHSNDVKRRKSKVTTYKNGNPRTLSVELFYDMDLSYELKNGDNEDGVKKYTDKIMQLTILGGNEKKPPVCSFKWGNLIFTGFVTSVDESFTRFNSQGVPIRAVINLSMMEECDENSSSQSDSQDLEGTLNDLYDMMETSMNWREIVSNLDLMNPRKAF